MLRSGWTEVDDSGIGWGKHGSVSRGRRLEVGGWRLEAGGWRLEVGGWRLEVRSIAPVAAWGVDRTLQLAGVEPDAVARRAGVDHDVAGAVVPVGDHRLVA